MGETGEQAHRATQRARGMNPRREQDACGVGFVARASGERSHEVLTAMLDLPVKAGQPFAVGAFCASDERDER